MRYDKQAAKDAGVPTWLRRHSRQYGKGIFHLLQEAKKYQNVQTLDHGRDRAAKRIGNAPLPERTVIEGIVNA